MDPVYPRVCGGTPFGDLRVEGGHSLSPRVRGNPVTTPSPATSPGSIPACAGEPKLALLTLS